MTVSYTQKVSDCKGFGSFWRLLFRIFEHVALYCDYFRNLIPISFVLGFYVSVVVQRWWEQYLSIPWPDSLALLCTAYIGGRGERERSIRTTVLRYVNLCCALTFSTISPRVGKKFPSYKELMEAGYLTPREMKVLENQRGRSSAALNTLPMMWACKVVEGARSCGYVRDDHGLRLLVAELMALRDKAGMLVRWTDISIPLVYTQVATMAVYSFFSFSVLGRQFLDPGQHYTNRTIDFFVPIFTLLQFVFYMGWLKVAESLVNPFGEDDDDFELECILERHLKMSYLLGDVTPSDDPLAEDDEDDCRWKVCPGAFVAPTEDLAFLTHSGRRREARLRRSMEEEAAAAAAAAASFRRTESDLETAILAPESMCSKGGDFVWEEMDLSGPADATRTPGTTTPTNTTPPQATPPSLANSATPSSLNPPPAQPPRQAVTPCCVPAAWQRPPPSPPPRPRHHIPPERKMRHEALS
ncbi:bestrophin-2-like isoform X2 [Portunus trituberculatus]|uniref:bestrophin-2-like isoform X2 n=1 Tax=Portunus trituberculatus TaxID=210409 RepID=UPI001E1CDD5D|nr:bestrophin-2-like isoform X2 [Portunus trituberculatus]